jgi:hypothetical protein
MFKDDISLKRSGGQILAVTMFGQSSNFTYLIDIQVRTISRVPTKMYVDENMMLIIILYKLYLGTSIALK